MTDVRLTVERIMNMTPEELRNLARKLDEPGLRSLILVMADVRERKGCKS